MNDDTIINSFISGTMEGVTSTPAPTTKVKSVKPRPEAERSADHAIVSRTQIEMSKSLKEFLEQPLADPNAEVIGRDPFGRKIELHPAGWEQSKGLTRRFSGGDKVTIKSGLMAGTLTMPQMHGGGVSYILERNAPHVIEECCEYIESNGTVVKGNTKPSLAPRTIQGVVIDRPEGKTVTVGLLVKYEVMVTSPPGLAGLILMEGPANIIGSDGLDGYGNPV
ncbi:MAG: hypothetical protein WAN50_03025 [Minisyncoccia bacterium]